MIKIYTVVNSDIPMANPAIAEAFRLLETDDLAQFQELVPSKVSPNAKYQYFPLIFKAIELDAHSCLHWLLQNEVNIKIKNKRGQSPLMYALTRHNMVAVYALINAKCDLTVKDENGWTPLHWAAQVQDLKGVQILLEFGANPNAVDFEGATPLHVAGDGDSTEIVTLLIERGADPSIRNEFGTKASELCINRGHEIALLSPEEREARSLVSV